MDEEEFPRNWQSLSWQTNLPLCMEPEGASPCSQKPAAPPHSELTISSSQPITHQIHFKVTLPSTPMSPKCAFGSAFPTKVMSAFPTQLFPPHQAWFDYPTVFGVYKPRRYPLYNFRRLPVTFSLSGPYCPFITLHSNTHNLQAGIP
jgi:hypothetical protein